MVRWLLCYPAMNDAIGKILHWKGTKLPALQQIRAFTVAVLQKELAGSKSAKEAAKRLDLSYRALRRMVVDYNTELGPSYDSAVTEIRRKNRGS